MRIKQQIPTLPIISIFFVCMILCSVQLPAVGAAQSVIVIEGGTLIDGTGIAPVPDAVVVVKGSRIIAAGPAASVEIPKGAQRINAAGRYVLPGLIDNHVHFRDWQGELYIAHGVTTIKDLGNPIEWMKALSEAQQAGRIRVPRIYYVGNVIDAPPPTTDHYLAPENPEQARAYVRKLRDAGAIGIKVHHQMTPDLLRAIADEAHKMHLTVTGHLGIMGAREAALAGIDGLDHGLGIGHSLSPYDGKPGKSLEGFEAYFEEMDKYYRMDPKKYDELIDLLVERGVIVLPTFVSYWRVATDQADAYAKEDARYARMPELKYIPDDVREILLTSNRYKAPSPEHNKKFRTGYSKMQDFLRRFRKAGGRILPGSSTVEMVPGLSLIRELELMLPLGYTPPELIEAVTRGNAEFMGIAHELGTIEAGKLADIIIIRRNPLTDITNLNSVEKVMIGGVFQDLKYHPDYSIGMPRPKLTRPLWIEKQLQ